MAVSPIALALETLRQDLAQDSDFYKKIIYFFELKIPSALDNGTGTSFVFPLLLLQGYEMEEPFTLEKTFTQGGGVYTEENGIVERIIRLRGTTGFKPRTVKGSYSAALNSVSPDKKSYSRSLPAFRFTPISGQRHFQYLQDAVFRTYADLKRDPATSEGTELIFHNPKEQEHWHVKPVAFKMVRDKTVLYNYDIQLLVVNPAQELDADFSEDKTVLDELKNALRTIKRGLDLVQGAINDLTALVNELSTFIKNISTIIDTVTSITDAVSNFAEGVTNLIESPYAILNSAQELIDSAMQAQEDLEALGDLSPKLPPTTKNKFNQVQDGLELIGLHPELFEDSTDRRLRQIKNRQELTTAVSAATLAAARASSAPTTLDAVENLGTALTPGDVQSAQGEFAGGRRVNVYTGARSVTVSAGDTLVNLAARYLGDARLWQHIAVLNGLKPPFVDDIASVPIANADEKALGGALGVGSNILVPTFAKPPEARAQLPVIGVKREETAEVHLLGRDLKLAVVGGTAGRPQYGWAVDVARGSQSLLKVEGRNNLAQALDQRLRTEKGTNTMYKRLGVEKVVGFNFVPADIELIRFRLAQAIQQDARIARVREILLEDSTDDALVTDITSEVRGFSEASKIRIENIGS